jgi:magnesium transporter
MSVAHDPSTTGRGNLQRHDLGRCRWWHTTEPSTDTFATLARVIDLPAAVLDAMHATPPRPHLTRWEGWRIWVLTPVTFQPPTAQVLVGHLVVATDSEVVVTCGGLPELAAQEFVARVSRRTDQRLADADAVVLAVIAEVLDAASRAVSALDDAVEDIEAAVFAPRRGSHAERIYRLKREVQTVRRCVSPLPELFSTAAASTSTLREEPVSDAGPPELLAWTRRLVEQVTHTDGLLDSVLAAHHTQVTIRQNDDMRRISAWVAIVAAPTAIASIYGMNFRYMPELTSPLGYPAVLLVMLSVCVTLYLLFRRSGWL